MKIQSCYFRNNYHEKYENQNLNFQGDRFRWNFVRASINSFQAYLVQWWSKSDRQIFHTYEMKIFDNYIFKIYEISISKNQLWKFHRKIDTSLHLKSLYGILHSKSFMMNCHSAYASHGLWVQSFAQNSSEMFKILKTHNIN